MLLTPTWIDPDEMFKDIHRDCKRGKADEELILAFCSSMAKMFPDTIKYQYLSCYIENPANACDYCTEVRDLPFVRLKIKKDPYWWRVYEYIKRHRGTPE